MTDASQKPHKRSFKGVFGLMNLPVSMAKGRLQLLNRVRMRR